MRTVPSRRSTQAQPAEGRLGPSDDDDDDDDDNDDDEDNDNDDKTNTQVCVACNEHGGEVAQLRLED